MCSSISHWPTQQNFPCLQNQSHPRHLHQFPIIRPAAANCVAATELKNFTLCSENRERGQFPTARSGRWPWRAVEEWMGMLPPPQDYPPQRYFIDRYRKKTRMSRQMYLISVNNTKYSSTMALDCSMTRYLGFFMRKNYGKPSEWLWVR